MVLEMKIPSPGESITEVEISQWLVKDGDVVSKDQTIAEIDSDKSELYILNSPLFFDSMLLRGKYSSSESSDFKTACL